VWEAYASAEPYWSVLTQDRFLRSQLTEAHLTAFFDSGRQHIAGLLATLKRHFDTSFPPRRVIDYGSGAGRLAIPFAELGAEVLGLDVSPSMVAEATRNAEQLNLPNCRFHTTGDLEWEAIGQFDLIHSFIVFQHIPEAEGLATIEKLLKRLAPGGIAALQVLYASHYVAPSPAPAPAADAAPAAAAAPAPERPLAHLPPMLMATYDMNRICTMCSAIGATSAQLLFTNHGPYAGAFVCAQRPA
jgi:SAM-dependent methyltransferase